MGMGMFSEFGMSRVEREQVKTIKSETSRIIRPMIKKKIEDDGPGALFKTPVEIQHAHFTGYAETINTKSLKTTGETTIGALFTAPVNELRRSKNYFEK
jgi:hypothetical protein